MKKMASAGIAGRTKKRREGRDKKFAENEKKRADLKKKQQK